MQNRFDDQDNSFLGNMERAYRDAFEKQHGVKVTAVKSFSVTADFRIVMFAVLFAILSVAIIRMCNPKKLLPKLKPVDIKKFISKNRSSESISTGPKELGEGAKAELSTEGEQLAASPSLQKTPKVIKRRKWNFLKNISSSSGQSARKTPQNANPFSNSAVGATAKPVEMISTVPNVAAPKLKFEIEKLKNSYVLIQRELFNALEADEQKSLIAACDVQGRKRFILPENSGKLKVRLPSDKRICGTKNANGDYVLDTIKYKHESKQTETFPKSSPQKMRR